MSAWTIDSQIFATSAPWPARCCGGRLEAEGIPTMVKGEGEGPYRAGPVYLWVAAEHEVAARDVVEAVQSGAYALDDDVDVDDVPEEPSGEPTPR